MFKKLFVGLLIILPITAWAHSPLLSVNPGDGVTLNTTPSEIVMVFKVPAKLIKIDMTKDSNDENQGLLGGLFGGNQGDVIMLGDDFLMKVDHWHEIALPVLPDGEYTIAWRAMGEDGHVIKGVFSFSVLES